MIRPILSIPDPVLREKSAPVEKFDDELRKLAADMLETMYKAPGIGLAAIQVGIPKRLLVIDLAKKDEPPQPQIFVNPEITAKSEEKAIYEEGCLSIPEYYEEVERPSRVTVRYQDEHGAEKTVEAEGLLSTCLQHEIDHLDGKLFIDYLSKLKRDRVVKKFTKIAKEKAREEEGAE
ncbi:peptide deformylase [Terrarubrum flagellatum]|uniref:peptide deformylase n=1 Tax=Terrirubrum flagellatum TaxID=2895980 RepID=UPI0031451C2E